MSRYECSAKKAKYGADSTAKKIDSSESWREKRKQYLTEKAKDVEFPTASEAKLEPKFMYDNETFVIHICFKCRQANRKMEAVDIDEEHQKLELVLCKICRSNYNIQRRSKFFNHELLLFKMSMEG
ncbi:hypothetical protein CAEBREN_26211 [Caenorhabditis brenneri]|uniref:Uncharacterized protein n=1 Tax=Caenorhabditis brenneri TaxID=135651 RepID=G0MSM6_CAEBE|nr:hypothetical protein CAEBREN_26211 [Caenorhabditis brenneri]